ncbi:MAG: CvpA family protein [Bacteroidales bacterium]|nr:CvpA family protein [Bacteroidales bacterium]
MNYIDLIIVALLVVAALFGFWKGFVRQLFGLVALFLGIFCAWHFSDFAASYISQWIDKNETAVAIISFAVTFIIVLLGVIFVGKIADKLVKVITLGLFNRLLGVLFSIVKMAFILSICIWLLQALDQLWPFFPHQECEQSFIFAPVAKLAPAVFPYIKGLITTISEF